MASRNPPKAVLFDIGGVCVQSPIAAIQAYEQQHNIPADYINHTIASTAPNGSWQRLERGEIPLDGSFFAAFGAELRDASRWAAHWRHAQQTRAEQPPVPAIDAEALFWTMMRHARAPDPDMWPALLALRRSARVPVVAALSNTVRFPDGVRDEAGALFRSGLKAAPLEVRPPTTRFFERGCVREIGDEEDAAQADDPRVDVRRLFDLFISSAHVGMRKPERRIYEFALTELRRLGRERGVDIEPGDVLFLDDIGGNLRVARECGMRTIKANLGRMEQAVRELESAVGVKLGDVERERARI